MVLKQEEIKIIRKKILFLEEILKEKYEIIQDNKIFISILEQTKNIIEKLLELTKKILKEKQKEKKIPKKNEDFLLLYEELLKIKKTLKEYKKSTTTFYKEKTLYYADEKFNIKKISYEEIEKKILFLKKIYEKIYENMLGEK